jgi:competence protein ComGC
MLCYNCSMLKKAVLNSTKKGFTLIEITVVVAIIGLLVTIAIAAGSAAKSGARDNQRKTDIQLLQVKLEAYREQNASYPTILDSLISSNFSTLPKDPINSGVNVYKYISLGFDCNKGVVSYYLYATLENNNNDTTKKVDYQTTPIVPGLSICSGTFPVFSSTKTYDVTSPI